MNFRSHQKNVRPGSRNTLVRGCIAICSSMVTYHDNLNVCCYFEDPVSLSTPDVYIGPEGMERLCSDIEVDPEDLAMLALAWKLKATQMGFFKKSEWLSGMQDLE